MNWNRGYLFLVFAMILGCQKSTIEEIVPVVPSAEGLISIELVTQIQPFQGEYSVGDTLYFTVPFPEPAISDSIYLDNTVVDMSLSVEMHQNNSDIPFAGNTFQVIIDEGDFDFASHSNLRSDFHFHSPCKQFPADFFRFQLIAEQAGIYSINLRPHVVFNNIPSPCENINFGNADQRGNVIYVFSPFAIHEDILSQLNEEQYAALPNSYFEQINEGKRLFIKVVE